MTDRPILFSAPMVRALLTGEKTQTRRAVKGWPLEWLAPGMFTPEYVADPANAACPYGMPGDRLWVRETWRTTGCGGRGDYLAPRDVQPHPVWYDADGQAPSDECVGKTRVSIHMPRWASRITLEITNVRAERLQDISEADASAEGVEVWAAGAMSPEGQRNYSSIGKFERLWSSINGIESWHSDPWVWVIEFKRA